MSKSAPRLGKGLSTLLAPAAHVLSQTHPFPAPAPLPDCPSPDASAVVVDLPLDRVRPNPKQPRFHVKDASLEGLADSIRQSGILQPIIVRRLADRQYEIVAGERRWHAAGIAGLKTIPAIVRELTDAESYELALVENLQREDLGPIERATAYQQLIDTLGFQPEQLARRLGESRANIVNYMRLLKLHPKIQEMITGGELGMGQARALVGIGNPQRQLAIALLTVRRNLSVRQVEALAQSAVDTEPATESPTERQQTSQNVHLENLQSSLSKSLGMPVVVRLGKKKNSGRIIISYSSLEEFDRFAELIGGKSFLEQFHFRYQKLLASRSAGVDWLTLPRTKLFHVKQSTGLRKRVSRETALSWGVGRCVSRETHLLTDSWERFLVCGGRIWIADN